MTVIRKGDPTPYEEDPQDEGIPIGKILGVLAGAAGILLVPMFCTMGHTRGATRSAKIEWQRRQALIQQAIAEESSQVGVVEAAGDDATDVMKVQ